MGVRADGVWAALSLLLVAADAAAESAPELPVEVQIDEMVNLPEETPQITVRAGERVDAIQVAVLEGARRVAGTSLGSLAQNGERQLSWRAEPGVHNYTVKVSGRTPRGTATVAVETVVSVMRPLQVDLRREQVDLEERVLYFSMNNPAGRAELTIHDPSGRVIHDATTDLKGRPAGARIELRWPELGEPIQRMDLRVHDASDSWSGFELLPFAVEIPHEDVVFETARWEIRASETPKLQAAYDASLQAIREHGRDIKARLYVLGHTDTVGSHADNLLLSQRRAGAIAQWFVTRGGISLPILAQGFGETRLLVPTADNSAEARNRRAQYILATQAPVASDWSLISAGK